MPWIDFESPVMDYEFGCAQCDTCMNCTEIDEDCLEEGDTLEDVEGMMYCIEHECYINDSNDACEYYER